MTEIEDGTEDSSNNNIFKTKSDTEIREKEEDLKDEENDSDDDADDHDTFLSKNS